MRADTGFSLMEVLVSVGIAGIVSAMASPLFISQSQFNTHSENTMLAIDATERTIDALRLLDPATLPTSGTSNSTVTVGGKNFTVQTAYCVTTALCSAVTRHLKLSASLNGKVYYGTETVFTQLR